MFLTVTKFGVIDEHKTFEGFTNVSDTLDKEVFIWQMVVNY